MTLPRLARRTMWAVGFALACSATLPCTQNGKVGAERVRADGVFRVAGVVVSDATGTPLAHTRVTLVDGRNARNAKWMITGEDGRFEFSRLSAGKYSLQGARRGYITSRMLKNGHQKQNSAESSVFKMLEQA